MTKYSREDAIEELDVHYETYCLLPGTHGIKERLGAPRSGNWEHHSTVEEARTALQQKHGDIITINPPDYLEDMLILPQKILQIGDPIFQVTKNPTGNLEIIETAIDRRTIYDSYPVNSASCDCVITYYTKEGASFYNQTLDKIDPTSPQAAMSERGDPEGIILFPTIESVEGWIQQQKHKVKQAFNRDMNPLRAFEKQLAQMTSEQSFADQLEPNR